MAFIHTIFDKVAGNQLYMDRYTDYNQILTAPLDCHYNHGECSTYEDQNNVRNSFR